jgi:hypothetical protein
LQAFDPACGTAIEAARNGFAQRGWDFAALLPPARRILSPSDFGLHNALRRPDGRLAFIDFEYFGWDDPVKAVADVMLHAGMDLPTDLAMGFLENVRPNFARRDDGFETRLRLLYPLYALIWCLIVLNEFMPDRWARRALAGAGTDLQELLSRQLQRARIRLARLKDIDDEFAVDT